MATDILSKWSFLPYLRSSVTDTSFRWLHSYLVTCHRSQLRTQH